MESATVDVDLLERIQLDAGYSDIQTKEFQCPICAKYFSRKFTLDAHMLIHKGEKPHMCQFCGKSFRQKGTLMRHKALHSSRHLFHCSLCNRGFRQKNVFIHHLRHRHNVSTETLDRRKYRTEPKDYQKIMDTLPPFVHADSTAIATSGKHFDALLSKSIQNDSFEPTQYNSVSKNAINSTLNALNTSEQLSIQYKEINELNSLTSHGSQLVTHENCLEDIKPIFNNNACEVNPSMSSGNSIVSALSHTSNSTVLATSSFCSQLSDVTSSNEINDDSIICLPCHRSFSNESEFKCHMKTHVQSVLLGEVNSSGLSSDLSDQNSTMPLNSGLSNNSSVLVSNSNQKSSENQKNNPVNQNIVVVSTDISDSTMESCLLPKVVDIKPNFPSSSFSKIKLSENTHLVCPVCNAFFQGEETFKKHAKTHDSYLLLKLYSEALNSKSIPLVNQSPMLNINFKSPAATYNSSNMSSQKKIKVVEQLSRKNVIKSRIHKNKHPSKRFQCMKCKKKFSRKILFEYHLQLHLNTKGFSCGCCKRKFSTKVKLLTHTRLNHFKTFTCSKCSKIFSYRKLFDLHKKRCFYSRDLKISSGSEINFPVISIESLLNSNVDDIVGIIPVCNNNTPNGGNSVKIGIPVMSVNQIKALYQSSSRIQYGDIGL